MSYHILSLGVRVETQADAMLAIEDRPHPTVDVEIGGEMVPVDEKVADLVVMFNRLPGFRTISSCQGSLFNGVESIWNAHVCIRGSGWESLAWLAFHELKSLMDEAWTFHQLCAGEGSEPTLFVTFPQESIPRVAEVLALILRRVAV